MLTHPAISHPPEYIVKFVRQVIKEYSEWDGEERRLEQRETVSIPLTVQPLNETLEPDGDPFLAVTRNLSGGGIGILTDDPLDHDYILITLSSRSGQTIDLIANIRHCTQEGSKYLIGGRFVVRWT